MDAESHLVAVGEGEEADEAKIFIEEDGELEDYFAGTLADWLIYRGRQQWTRYSHRRAKGDVR